MPEISLITTKLHIPRPRPELVPRPRLTAQLDQGLQRKLTLISAPAGFGKTTLLGEWIEQGKAEGRRTLAPAHSAGVKAKSGRQKDEKNDFHPSSFISHPARVAWVSLDEYDSDPVRFWSYVITALDSIRPGTGSAAMSLLQAPQPPPIETTLTALINAIAALPDQTVLILDDYHLIDSEAVHHALSFLIDHLPAQLHLMIISRVDPPLPLTRLRVRDQLIELGESDLRFTAAEAATFLNHVMDLNLSPADVAALEARTEGWIAGLQLAALSMQGRNDIHSFVRAFTGSHRYVIDYLAEEVLSRQPQHVQRFLLQTSILDRMCGSLCDAVTQFTNEDPSTSLDNQKPDIVNPKSEIVNSQEMLEMLDATNLFLIPLDDERHWYRYQHLFADFLREHLRKSAGEAEVRELHQRASVWYSQHDLFVEAVEHALAARNAEQAAQLVEQLSLDMLVQGEAITLQNWLTKLPRVMIQTHPRLALTWGWTKVITSEWDEVEPFLEMAESALSGQGTRSLAEGLRHDDAGLRDLWGEVAAMRSMIYGMHGEVERVIDLSYQALERLPENRFIIRSVLMTNLGNAYELLGDLTKAGQILAEAISIAEAGHSLLTTLSATGSLAILEEEQGQLHQAASLYRQAIRLVEKQAEERGQLDQPLPIGGWAYQGLAEILREQNELEIAKRYATQFLDLDPHENILRNRMMGHLILARILQAQGDTAGALDAIQQAERLTHKQDTVALWVSAVQARLWLAQGNLDAARQWAQTCDLSLTGDFNYAQYPGEYTTLVRVLIADEQPEEALDLLTRMHSIAESSGRRGRLLEVLLLQALTLYLQSQSEQALAPLTRALAIGEAGGYVRIFTDEGPLMAQLLHFARSRLGVRHQAYLDKLLDTFTGFQFRVQSPHGTIFDLPTKDDRIVDRQPEIPWTARQGRQNLMDPLSDRELEVLHLIADGLSNQEIADELVIAVSTVKSHANKIFSKLEVQNRTQAVARARELHVL